MTHEADVPEHIEQIEIILLRSIHDRKETCLQAAVYLCKAMRPIHFEQCAKELEALGDDRAARCARIIRRRLIKGEDMDEEQ